MAAVSASPPNNRQQDHFNVHPMDSSRLFTALLNLVHDSDSPGGQQLIAAPILRRLLSALHFRDANTLKHSRRVGLISVGIAARLGWEEDDLRIIEIASLIHDIGKIGIPDHILRKPGKLSPDEAEYIAVYHRVALALLQACQVHPDVTGIVAQSHGVDDEQRGHRNALSLGARILAVADAYDSLTTKQAFRSPYDRWEAMQILEEQSGKQFDRNVVAALGRWLDGPDASRLADERAAEVSIHVNAPVDNETRINANQLCHVFHHLYLLESLYDAFYMVDSNRQVTIWSSGASILFGRKPQDAMRRKWSRQLVSPLHFSTDPIESVFLSGTPSCHSMTVKRGDDEMAEVDVQTIPIHSEDGTVCGVVELICNDKESKRHRGQFRSLQMAATRDPLTGVMNRGELERQLKVLYEGWTSDPAAVFSVVFMDLDHFKQINDQLSHAVGDRVLVDCARLMQDELYSGELVGRYGGEEFVILCPETSVDAAEERAERLRRIFMATKFADRDDLRVTASFGVAEISSEDTAASIMSRADLALYEAKRTGRNRTSVAIPETNSKQAERTRRRVNLHQSATILTYVAADMLQMKLAGYVENHKAKILSVEAKRLELSIGQSGLLSGWSRASLEKIPVKLTIDISDVPADSNRNVTSRMLLKVTVESIAKMNDEEQFRARATQVIEQLRSYMIAGS